MDFNIDINKDTALKPAETLKTETISQSVVKQAVSNSDNLDFTNFLQKANNPGVVFFTMFFKLAAVVR